MNQMALEIRLREILSKNNVIICLGNPIRGDDAFGIHLGEFLKKFKKEKVIIAETSPVNYLGKIISLEFEQIIFIDAIDFNLDPGSIIITDVELIENSKSLTTHYQEIDDLLHFIELDGKTPSQVLMIGVQISHIDLMSPMSDSMKHSCDILKQKLEIILNA